MKVLHVHKYFYARGGDAVVFFDTARLLEQAGHVSAYFSMHHPMNLPTEYSRYFVSHIDLNAGGGLIHRMKAAGRILYSVEARRKIDKLIHDFKPDIAHLHNICHQLSPSIIDALKNNGVPVVMTMHDYKLVCPAYTLLSGNGKPCEECRGGKYYRVVLNRCTKGSRLKSGLNMIEMYLHHTMLHIYDQVDVFISPSRFLLEQTQKMGFTGEIVHLPNFVNAREYTPEYDGHAGNIVYFGRLSREKGVGTLIEAMKGVNDAELVIVGDGPVRNELEQQARSVSGTRVRFLGHQSSDVLKDIIRKAHFTVIPSEWYENNPRAVLEAFALGKPVIGARIGGIPELIKDGETGLTFSPGDSNALRNAIVQMTEDPDKTVEMGKKARTFVETHFNPERHYQALMDIYQRALLNSASARGKR